MQTRRIAALPALLPQLSVPTGKSLRKALDAWTQRRQLSRLDASALNDIGMSETDANREAKRPIWDVPGHWRQ